MPYDSYTYSTQTGEAVAQFCPTPYYPAFTIDKATIGVPLVTPTCMCFDKEGNLYITDSSANRLLVLDKEYKLKASIDTLEDEEGNFEFLGGPEGIFVTDDGSIYLCDTKQKRILVLDQNYKLVRKYEGIRPLGENQEEDYMFLPTRIVVDASGNMYVLVQNEYQGIMQIDSDGRFISFVGGNKVTYDPVTRLWKKIMSKEQRAQLEQFLPVEYTNLSQDGEGLIYTVSKADNSDPIKRLNLSGKDVLIRNGYTDVIGDVLPARDGRENDGLPLCGHRQRRERAHLRAGCQPGPDFRLQQRRLSVLCVRWHRHPAGHLRHPLGHRGKRHRRAGGGSGESPHHRISPDGLRPDDF